MKKILLITLLFFSGLCFSQQFPIGAYRITWDSPPVIYPGVNDPATQLDVIFPLLQQAHINYGVPFTQNSSSTYINNLLDEANAHGVGIILPDVVESYSGVERFYLAGNSSYFVIVSGDILPDNDAEIPFGSTLYSLQSRKATSTSEYLVSTPRSSPFLYSGQSYRCSFRLKIHRSVPLDPSDQIALLEVIDGSSTISRTLLSSDFSSDDVYYRFSIDITYHSSASPLPPPSMPAGQTSILAEGTTTLTPDLRVKWLGNGDLWFDNVRVDGARSLGPDYAEDFFNGDYNTEIQNHALDYMDKPALQRFYFEDEPYYTQYFATRVVNSQLETAGANTTTGKGLGHAAIDDYWYSGDFSRYTIEAAPFELAPDVYRFHYNDPLPSAGDYTSKTQLGDGDYRDGLQTQIGKFRNAQTSSAFSRSGNWWYYPNIGIWNITGQTYNREPYLSEIDVQVYLALTYGAKGIMYFNFWSDNYSPSPSPCGSGVTGLISEDDLSTITNSHWGEDKWNGIKSLNQKLAGTFGSTLMNLTWQNAYSIHLGQPTGTFISSVTTSDAANQRYVELGIFKEASNIDYFMVVNRRTKNTESRDITVTFNKSSSYTTWRVTEVGSNNTWILSKTGNFQTTYQPGEGKLFKFEPLFLNNSETFSNNVFVNSSITVPSGKSLTVQAGAIVKFNNHSYLYVNGTLNAQGIVDIDRIPVTFDFISPYNQNGIRFYSGSSGTLYACDIKNGYYGVFCNGCLPSITMCNITNNINGIYIYNAGVRTNNISNNTIQNNSYHGIYMTYSSPRNVVGNTIQYNSQAGIYAVSYCTPYIYGNKIKYNGAGGITCASLSPAVLGYNYRYQGYNVITGNYGGGVGCGYESDVIIGASNAAGYNSIHDNTNYEVTGDYDSHVMAENNWWNRQPPTYPNYYYSGDFHTSYGGTVDYDPALHYNPVGGQMATSNEVAESNLSQPEVSGSSFFDSELLDALNDLFDGKYDQAITKYEKRFKKESDKSKKKYILRRIAECYNLSEKSGFVDFLNTDIRKSLAKNDELYAETLELENMFLIGEDKCDQAANNFELLKNEFSENAAIVKPALFNLVCLNYNQLNDVSKAKEYLDELKSQFPNDELTLHAIIMTGDIDNISSRAYGINKEANAITEKNEIPDKYDLLGNYPNPFNPTTTIRYSLPYQSSVELKIYDIMGREIKSFSFPAQSQGYQNVIWNGTNENGDHVSSGIYLYTIKIKSLENDETFQETSKLLLMK